MESLLIRVDASPRIGAGHVMRCVALAEGWRKAGPVWFLMAECPPAIEQMLSERMFGFRRIHEQPGSAEDALITRAVIDEIGAASVVIDGYCFGSDFARNAVPERQTLLVIDDTAHLPAYHGNLVLNQNAGSDPWMYRGKSNQARLLLGSEYVLLRPEFLRAGAKTEHPAIARNVLINFGASDPGNLTASLLHAIANLTCFQFCVVIGPANPRFEELHALAVKCRNIEIVRAPSDLPGLMRWADIVVSAAGSTVWELAYLGIPTILVIAAENQRAVARAIESAGAGLCVGDATGFNCDEVLAMLNSLALDQPRRVSIGMNARGLVDGRGVSRVIAAVRSARVSFRSATSEDCRTIWEWANDPLTRQASFSRAMIPYEEHEVWFQRRLREGTSPFWVACDHQGVQIGQVRFSLHGSEAELSFSVNPASRGRGHSAPMVLGAVQKLFSETSCKRVQAFVKEQNIASLKALEAAGFRRVAMTKVHNASAHKLALQSDQMPSIA